MILYVIAAYLGLINPLLHWLIIQDQKLFILINSVLTNPFFDSIFPVWREAQTWYPLYLFLLVFSLLNFGKRAGWFLFFFGLTIAICDQVSSGIIKDWVARIRPCSAPELAGHARLLLNRCPGSGSFTSSHATNHFGMAVFIIHTCKSFLHKWKYALYLWAASICYAQVYVGVHYPLDVIGGAVLGALIGYGTAAFYVSKFGTPDSGNLIPIEKVNGV